MNDSKPVLLCPAHSAEADHRHVRVTDTEWCELCD